MVTQAAKSFEKTSIYNQEFDQLRRFPPPLDVLLSLGFLYTIDFLFLDPLNGFRTTLVAFLD